MQKFQEWGLENSVSVGKKQVGISFGPHLLSMWKPIHIKAAITVPSEKKKKKKIKVELWCLCCLFFPECGIYFLILLPCRWRKSLCTERSLSFEPQPLCLAKCNCMKFLNQIFPENVKSAPSPVISLLTWVFCGGWKAACKVHCSIPRFHGSDIWVWSWNAIKESCAGAASFSQEKKNSFNSENGGVDEFERVFSPCVFSDLPSPELHPSSVRIINPTHNLLWMLPPPCFMDII